MKFTFKKEPRQTGLAGVGHPYQNTNIKFEGKEVGMIYGPNWQDIAHVWSIRLQVKESKDPAETKWKNITFKARFKDEPEARAWLNKHLPTLQEKYTFHYHID